MRLRTTLRVAVVAGATALVAAVAVPGTPAGAVQAGAGAFTVSAGPGPLHDVQATFSYDATPFLGWTLVEFNCKVVSWVDPASTGVDECSVDGTPGLTSPNNTPGPFAADAGTAWIRDGGTPTACVQGSASFAEDKLGPRHVRTVLRCEPLNLLDVTHGS